MTPGRADRIIPGEGRKGGGRAPGSRLSGPAPPETLRACDPGPLLAPLTEAGLQRRGWISTRSREIKARLGPSGQPSLTFARHLFRVRRQTGCSAIDSGPDHVVTSDTRK